MNKPLCVIAGPVFNRSGYGDWTTEVAKSIIRYDKYDVKIVPRKWGVCQSRRYFEEGEVSSEDIGVLNRIINGPLNQQPDIFIQLSIPSEFQKIGKYNIGMTAGIETTIASGEFIEGVNNCDLTIALSNHAKNVLVDSRAYKQMNNGQHQEFKVQKPIEVCFWGADTNIYKKTDEKVQSVEDALNKVREDFAFLFVGQWTHENIYQDRKAIGYLVKTFCETFEKNNKKPCLILKTSGVGFSTTDRFVMLDKIKKIRSKFDNPPNVYLLHGELNDVEMNALFNHEKIKAHVSFTHGEGYGHPLLLQSLSGKPLFVSNWSGHLDFLNKDYVNLLEGKLETIPKQAVNKWLLAESKWFDVSYPLASEKLKNFYQGYSKNNKFRKKAEKLRIENSEKFSIEKMDEKLWSILDQYVPKFATENKFVLPKLKPIGDDNSNSDIGKISLPKLKPIGESNETSNKITLPKLKLS